MGSSVSLGVHESQARWWENFVARSRPFWEHYLPELQAGFPTLLEDVTLDRFTFAVNAVSPSLIRVEADEVTYNLHVLLRVELERALFKDELQTSDLPEAWDEKMEQYLGIRPSNQREGVLQDMHWSHGMFGYFPTYTLGNLYAAQLNDAIRKEIPHLDRQVARGEFADLLEWMRSRIHRFGSLYPPRDLIERATGTSLETSSLIGYLREKFGALYGL